MEIRKEEEIQEEEEEIEEREMDVETTMNMLEAVEKDANAVASSFTSLLSSVQSALSEVTCTSVEHMNCHCDAAGHLQDAAISAASKGNRFINSCLRLNEEIKGLESLAVQLMPDEQEMLKSVKSSEVRKGAIDMGIDKNYCKYLSGICIDLFPIMYVGLFEINLFAFGTRPESPVNKML